MDPYHDSLAQQLSIFENHFEALHQKMTLWEQSLAGFQKEQIHDLSTYHQTVIDQLHEIAHSIDHLKSQLNTPQLEDKRHHLIEKHDKIQAHIETLESEIEELSKKTIDHIHMTATRTIECIDHHLNDYDPQQLKRIAHESYENIANQANETIKLGHHILNVFQIRQIMVAIIIAFSSTVITGLYMNDELPWEHHQKIHDERKAGQLLLHAWPQLTKEERLKIIGKSDAHHA
jgi:hypothetical protein